MRRDQVASTLIRRHFNVVCLLGSDKDLYPTVNQLVDIYKTFCKALDNEGKEVKAVFLDISKAFDRV